MATRNRMFDDAARVAGGALGTLAGIKREIEALARQQFERLVGGLDLVTRDEFEAVKAMAAKARAEQEALAERLAALETAAAPAKRPAPRAAKRPRKSAAD
jgi:BMFP domain-containing protein YqiC